MVIVDVDDSQSHGGISINPHDIVDDIFPVYSRYIASIFNIFDGTLRLFPCTLIGAGFDPGHTCTGPNPSERLTIAVSTSVLILGFQISVNPLRPY